MLENMKKNWWIYKDASRVIVISIAMVCLAQCIVKAVV